MIWKMALIALLTVLEVRVAPAQAKEVDQVNADLKGL
jgi:hypothetical protein